jgi:hypothetical protein
VRLHLTQTAGISSRDVSAYDEGRFDPAALEMRRRDLEDAAQAYRAVLLGVAVAVILAGWAWSAGVIGWHIRGWAHRHEMAVLVSMLVVSIGIAVAIAVVARWQR